MVCKIRVKIVFLGICVLITVVFACGEKLQLTLKIGGKNLVHIPYTKSKFTIV